MNHSYVVTANMIYGFPTTFPTMFIQINTSLASWIYYA